MLRIQFKNDTFVVVLSHKFIFLSACTQMNCFFLPSKIWFERRINFGIIHGFDNILKLPIKHYVLSRIQLWNCTFDVVLSKFEFLSVSLISIKLYIPSKQILMWKIHWFWWNQRTDTKQFVWSKVIFIENPIQKWYFFVDVLS